MSIQQLVFTHCATGKGFNPEKSSGYQVKAKSLNVPGEDALSKIATHSGQLVHPCSPPEARQAEETWRNQTQDVAEGVPRNVLAMFPVIWTYRKLAEDSYALVRTSYIGLTRDARKVPGNFFAHALVFSPRLLGNSSNPLGLEKSSLFNIDPDAVMAGPLPELHDFGAERPGRDTTPLSQSRILETLPSLASALATAGLRPVAICINDWRQAVSLAGALLEILPPALRRTTTFTTFAQNPLWPGVNPQDEDLFRRPNQLTIICPTDGTNGPAPDDPGLAGFAVFNFVTGRHSQVNVSRFGHFVSECILQRKDLIQKFFRMTASLGCDGDIAVCEQLLPLYTGSQPGDFLQQMRHHLQVCSPLVKDSRGADAVLLEIKDQLRNYMETDFEATRAFGIPTMLKPVISLLKPEAGATVPRFIDEVTQDINAQFAQGRIRRGLELIAACGKWKGEALRGSFYGICDAANSVDPANERELDALVGHLTYMLEAYQALPESSLAIVRSLIAILPNLTREQIRNLWCAIELPLQQIFSGQLGQEHCAVITEACQALDPVVREAPEAALFFNRLSVLIEKESVADYYHPFEVMALASMFAEDATEKARSVLALVVESVPETHRTLCLGRMADRSLGHGMEKAEDVFIQAFNQVNDPEAQIELARAGYIMLPSWNFLASLNLTQSPAVDENRVENWLSRPEFQGHDIADALCDVTAAYKDTRTSNLARYLLRRPSRPSQPGRGYLQLFQSIADSFPLGRISGDWHSLLASPPAALDKSSRSRLQFSLRLGDFRAGAIEGTWNLTRFGEIQEEWGKFGNLSSNFRDEERDFIMDLFAITGLRFGNEALGFLAALPGASTSSPESVGQFIANALRGQDAVTQASCLTAFVHGAAMGRGDLCRQVLPCLARELTGSDPGLRDLCSNHIWGRLPKLISPDILRQICGPLGLNNEKQPEKKKSWFGLGKE